MIKFTSTKPLNLSETGELDPAPLGPIPLSGTTDVYQELICFWQKLYFVGVEGIGPTTSRSQTERSTDELHPAIRFRSILYNKVV